MGVDQFVLPAAVVQVAILDLAILVHVIIQRQLGLAEVLPVDDDVIWMVILGVMLLTLDRVKPTVAEPASATSSPLMGSPEGLITEQA